MGGNRLELQVERTGEAETPWTGSRWCVWEIFSLVERN